MSKFNAYSIEILEAFGQASGLNKPMKPGLGARKLTNGLTTAKPANSPTKPLNAGQIKIKSAIRESADGELELDWQSLTIAEAEDVVEAICQENAELLEADLIELGLTEDEILTVMWDLDEDFMKNPLAGYYKKLADGASKNIVKGMSKAGKASPTTHAAHKEVLKRAKSHREGVSYGKMAHMKAATWGAKEAFHGRRADTLDRIGNDRKRDYNSARMTHAGNIAAKWAKRAKNGDYHG